MTAKEIKIVRALIEELKGYHDKVEEEWGDDHSWKDCHADCGGCVLIQDAEKIL